MQWDAVREGRHTHTHTFTNMCIFTDYTRLLKVFTSPACQQGSPLMPVQAAVADKCLHACGLGVGLLWLCCVRPVVVGAAAG